MKNIYEWIDKRHGGCSLIDVALGLTSESGECAQIVRKFLDDDTVVNDGAMIMELSDVYHYLILGCAYYGITMEDLEMVNRGKMHALDCEMRMVFEGNMLSWDGRAESLKSVVEAANADVELLKW